MTIFCRTGESFMKKYFFLAPVIFIFLSTANLSARDRGPDGRWMTGFYGKDCVPLMDLDLTQDQRTAIVGKERTYREKIMHLRIQLIEKKLEFRRMLRDPEVDEKVILDNSMEIGNIIGNIQRMRLDHYLGIRRILSPDQIRTMCPPLDKPFIRERERRAPRDKPIVKERERRP